MCSPFGTTPEEIVPKKIVDTCSVKKRNYYVCVCFFLKVILCFCDLSHLQCAWVEAEK